MELYFPLTAKKAEVFEYLSERHLEWYMHRITAFHAKALWQDIGFSWIAIVHFNNTPYSVL